MTAFATVMYPLVSAVLASFALPNEVFEWGVPFLGLVALVPLYLALAEKGSWKRAFVVGALFGGMAHGLSSYWLWFFKDFRFWTLGTSILAYMVVYGFVGMYLYGAIRRTGLLRPLVFAAVWTVFEWGKSNGFLGYPWGLLPYSWNTVAPAVQIAESTGVYGLSFALAWFGAALAETVRPGVRPRSVLESDPLRTTTPRIEAAGHLVVATTLLLAITAWGFVALERPRVADRHIQAVMVQMNIDPWEGSEAGNLESSIQLAADAIGRAGSTPDMILFSETALRRPWNGFRKFFERTPSSYPLVHFLRDTGSWLFTGAPEILDYKTYEATNSVLLIDPAGTQVKSYAKMHPVPFAEAIPFWDYRPFREFIQNVVGLESGWVMGTERVIFEVPTKAAGLVRFAAPICFEDAFAYLCRDFVNDGAELLVNLTNDSWSRTRSAEIQHFVAARFRSIELRRTLVRSTNGGVSAVVGPDGDILFSMPLFTPMAETVSIPVYTAERTPYLDYGDWFVALLAFFLAVVTIILWYGSLRSAG